MLFVPSGWHHCVSNEAGTLSINHNWLNGHNLVHAWTLLAHEHSLATQQLEDCRWEWGGQWVAGGTAACVVLFQSLADHR